MNAGTVIKGAGGCGDFIVQGTLEANGTAANPVTLTSINDDTIAGDTNGNGAASAPAPGNWDGIRAQPAGSGQPNPTLDLDHVAIRYAQGSISTSQTITSITNSSIDEDSSTGIGVSSPVGNPTVSGNTVTDAGGDAIAISSAVLDLAKLDGNSGSSNGLNGVRLQSTELATNSSLPWSGSFIPVLGSCSGLLIRPNVKLTMNAGTVIKGAGGCGDFIVQGTLEANGTAANPVTLTSINDDTIAGDTNGNGAASAPAPGNWDGIRAQPAGSGQPNPTLDLDHVAIRYAQGSISTSQTITSITNSSIDEDSSTGIGVSSPVGNPTVSGNTVTDAGGDAIAISSAVLDLAKLDGNSGSSNGLNGVRLQSTELATNSSLPWSGSFIPVLGSCSGLLIRPNVKLTMNAGTVIKGAGGCGDFIVQGTLEANGTAANPVTLTSINDDTIAGDTNGNGAASAPAPGNWDGIRAQPAGSGQPNPTLDLDHVAIRYASTAISVSAGSSATVRGEISRNLHGIAAPACFELQQNCPAPVDARQVHWGDLTGPYPFGGGDAVSGHVQVVPWVGYTETQARNYGFGGGGAGSSSGSYSVSRRGVRDPVDPVSGNFSTDLTDISVAEPGPALALSRSYNAQSVVSGSFGPKWSFSWDTRVDPMSNAGTTNVIWGDGRVDAYERSGDTYTPAAGNFAALVAEGSGFRVVLKDATTYHFDFGGRLTSVVDDAGNTLNVAHAVNGDVSSVSDDAGRSLTFTRDAAGLITSATDPAGNEWTYGYSAAGDLTSVADPAGGTVHYEYDAQHRMLSATDATGNITVANTYDSSDRVLTQTDALGKVSTFSYDLEDRRTDVTDPNGGARSYSWDQQGRLTMIVDQLGNSVEYGYDAAGNLTSMTNEDGGVSTYTYDARGNRLSATDPDGKTRSRTFSAQNLMLTEIDALGETTTFTYDSERNPISITDPLSRTTTMTHTARGELASITDPLDNTTTFAYNARGDLTSATDPIGRVTTATYDPLGRPLTETNPAGELVTHVYDEVGRETTIIDGEGGVTTTDYDAAGNPVEVTDPDGVSVEFAYDAMNRRISETDEAGETTAFDYDDNGNLITITDPLGGETHNNYDAANRLIGTVDPEGRETDLTLDGRGNVLSETDSAGNATTFTYDGRSNLTTTTDALDHITQIVYDAESRPIQRIDANNHMTHTTYDDAGQVTSTKDGLGRVTSFEYDDAGRLIEIGFPGSTTQLLSYDDVGQHTATTWPGGASSTMSYDNAGRLVTRSDAAGTEQRTYDDAGRLIDLDLGNGESVSYEYTPAGRLSERTALGATQQFGYNTLGRLHTISDPSANATLNYDERGVLNSAQLPNGVVLAVATNANGEPTRLLYTRGAATLFDEQIIRNSVGLTTQLSGTDPIRTFTYDDNDRLASADGAGHSIDYEYDGVGNRTRTITDGNAVTTTFDAADQPLTRGSVTYAHDPRGNIVSSTSAGQTTTWTYDARNHLEQITLPGGASTTLVQTDDGRVSTSTTSAGTERLVEDPTSPSSLLLGTDGASSSRYVAAGDILLATVGATTRTDLLDHLGSVRGLAASSGTPTITRYDPWGTATLNAQPAGTPGFTAGYTLPASTTQLGQRALFTDLGSFGAPDPTGTREAHGTQSLYTYVADQPLDQIDPMGTSLAGYGGGYFDATARGGIAAYNTTCSSIAPVYGMADSINAYSVVNGSFTPRDATGLCGGIAPSRQLQDAIRPTTGQATSSAPTVYEQDGFNLLNFGLDVYDVGRGVKSVAKNTTKAVSAVKSGTAWGVAKGTYYGGKVLKAGGGVIDKVKGWF